MSSDEEYEDMPTNMNQYDDDDDDGDVDVDDDGLGGDDQGGEEDGEENITAWGTQKKRFYQQGDEAGSDEEAEEDEEEEAKLIEKLQNEQLKDNDFFEVFGGETGEKEKEDFDEEGEDAVSSALKNRFKNMEGLSEKEKLALLKKEAPELLNIIKEYKNNLKELKYKYAPLIAYFKNRKNDSKEGQQYLEIKYNLLTSYCMTLSFYILLNLKGKSVKDHPVIKKIISLKTSLGQLAPLDKKLQPEMLQILKKIENEATQKPAKKNPKKEVTASLLKKGRDAAKVSPNLFAIDAKAKAKKVAEASKKAKAPETTKPADQLNKRTLKEMKSVKPTRDEDEDDMDGFDLDDGYDDDDDDMAGLYGGYDEDEDGDDGDAEIGNEYYNQMKQVKKVKRDTINKEKEAKRVEEYRPVKGHYVEEENGRKITKKILENKGLQRRRGKKEQRNSRVKHKLKYEKALWKKKSKGHHVREKGDVYKGETNISAGKIRSQKLK